MHAFHSELPDDRVVDAISESTRAVIRLQDALTALGITLPSLGIDVPSCGSPFDPRPLVELGRCNLETAAALADALCRAADDR